MNIIDLIMNTEILKENPPILLDIGASGNIHNKWRDIAKYSICIAFDPDARDVEQIQDNTLFKKTYFIDSLVSYEKNESDNFYLTESPHCSSMLKPLQFEADKYSFGYLFEVKRTIKVNAITLEQVLQKLDITKVDWIKLDSQGIDLKVFQSLPRWDKVIAVEFEPGFIDLYTGEDKISHVLTFMEKQKFWMSEFLVLGDVRISKSIKEKYFKEYLDKRLLPIIKKNPGWAGITYMNDFSNLNSKRDYLLGIAFNYIDNNLGYCFELCDEAMAKFDDTIFKDVMQLLIEQKTHQENSKYIQANPIEFTNSLSETFRRLERLKIHNEKFVLYGAGTGAELILSYMPNSIEYIVDMNYDNIENKFDNILIYSLDKLKKDSKRIIVSVFGRESEIVRVLVSKYNLDKSQIITIWQ